MARRPSNMCEAELYHGDDYYGFLALLTDEQGNIVECGYNGKHPVLEQTKDWRKQLGLYVSILDGRLTRHDTNQTPFLGVPHVARLDKRIGPNSTLGTQVGIALHNHGLMG